MRWEYQRNMGGSGCAIIFSEDKGSATNNRIVDYYLHKEGVAMYGIFDKELESQSNKSPYDEEWDRYLTNVFGLLVRGRLVWDGGK